MLATHIGSFWLFFWSFGSVLGIVAWVRVWIIKIKNKL